jgi:CheY-like chemotaxis protein/HPt (histidine-containing phosphotransfer) domain-containing protein
MSTHDLNDAPARLDSDDPEAAIRDARQRFLASFPKRSDSIGLLLSTVATIGSRGPVLPLRHAVHRMSGLAGTLGFPTVSARARELEQLLDGVDSGSFDASRANLVFEALERAFTDDLGNPPDWVGPGVLALGSGRIMVVEDDEDQREVVCINLAAAGYQPVPVPTGDQAVAAARAERPDLILLDANLPGMDGYTVCRLLKGDTELASTPVLFITARSSLDDRAVGLTLGADDYLVKPVDMSELMLRIQVLLARRAQAANGSR